MPTPTKPSPDAPLTREHLAGFFERAEKPDHDRHLIGTELEKFGIALGPDGSLPQAVSYDPHVLGVLHGLQKEFGWEPGPDRGNDGQVVELRREGASITLEPGGQLELSGAPLRNVHETCAEFTRHYRELDTVSKPLNVGWMAAGHHPWATREDIHWMPKGRYAVMRAYLPKQGGHALDMMTRTCTVQANFDFASEAECGARVRAAVGLSPIITAMFANSPYLEGTATGDSSLRTLVWTDVDPARCGILPFAFDRSFSYEAYVDWALDVPMFFVKRGGHYHPHHATFRQFLQDGFQDPDGGQHRASFADWELHLSTVFPEVRLKPFIEVRSADSVSSAFVCALPALWKGLLYDAGATEEAWSLVADLSLDEREALWREAGHQGLRSARIANIATQLLRISRTMLDGADVRDNQGRTESRFLDPLQALVETGRCPGDLAADQMATRLGKDPGRDAEARRAFLTAFHFAGAGGPDDTANG